MRKNSIIQLFVFSFVILVLFSCKKEEKYVGLLENYPGEKNGELTAYHDNGKMAEFAHYKNNQLQGVRKLYNTDGIITTSENYEKGQLEGTYKTFFTDGTIQSEGYYSNNTMSNLWKRFYSNGQLKEEVTFVDNNENGPFVEFNENGTLAAKGSYLEGDFEHGPLELYDSLGVLIRKMNCNKGICRTSWKADHIN